MNYISALITDTETLQQHYVFRDGFVFTSIRKPVNVFNAIVLRSPSDCDCQSPKVGISTRTLEEHIALINRYQLKFAIVIAEDIHFLRDCPSLEIIDVIPAKTSTPDFDFSPLYTMPNLKSLSCSTYVGNPYDRNQKHTTIDYAFMNGLQDLKISDASDKGHYNIHNLSSLKSLQLTGASGQDLSGIIGSKELDTLYLMQCKFRSLAGIEKAQGLRCLYLNYCRSLQDIGTLLSARDTLTALEIENCPKIKDFSCLSEMHKLEFLKLRGGNSLPSLAFMKELPNLKTFVFNMEVLDGDLSPCLNLSWAYSERNRKCYNLRDNDLPKRKFVAGTEGIEDWRCFY